MKLNSYATKLAAGCLAVLGAAVLPNASAAVSLPVASLLNEQTYAVVALDASRLDVKNVFDGALTWLVKQGPDAPFPPDLIREATNGIAAVRGIPEKWMQDFQQAGGQEFYAMAYAADGLQFILAIPLGKNGNREAIEKLVVPLLSQANLGALGKQVKGDCLVMGNRDTVERLVSGKGAPRPDLESALASQDASAVKLVLAPTSDQRRVLREMVPAIPMGTNSIPTDAIVRSLSWCSLGVNLVPAVSVKLLAHTLNAGSAQELVTAIRSLLGHALALQEDQAKTLAEKALSALDPVTDQSQVVIRLDEKALDNLFLNLIVPSMAKTQSKATAINAMNNAKQIVLACILFHEDNKKWPEQLQALLEKSTFLPDASALKDPRHPQREIGFEYLIPGKNSDKYPAATHIVIHEKLESWPPNGLCVGFLDGHAEIMANKARFDSLLAESKTRNAEKE